MQQDPQFQFDTPQNPLLFDGTAAARAGFTTRPVRNWRTDPWPIALWNNGVNGCEKFTKLKNKAIVADSTATINNSASRVRLVPHVTSINVLYGDGSARAINADKAINAKILAIVNQTTTLPLTELIAPTPADAVTSPGLWDLFDRN